MKKKVIEFWRRFIALFRGSSDVSKLDTHLPDFDPRKDEVINTPMSEEYLKEIEENEKCAEAISECVDDRRLMKVAARSATAEREGIDNTITDEEVKENVRALNMAILIPLMAATGWLYTINSWFRSLLLNIRVGGARTSQHLTGEAVDFWCRTILGVRLSTITVVRKILELGLVFDQIIFYPNFVHVSFRRKGKNRGQILYHSTYTGERL